MRLLPLASATSTNEALFLMKKYFQGGVDFRLANETQTYQQQQDDLLRRVDKHPNTQGALDLGLAGNLNGLQGILDLAETQADPRDVDRLSSATRWTTTRRIRLASSNS